jgi:hypothetical protein
VRDWNVLVREKFSGKGLTQLQQAEVVSELAAHLEDLYEHERSLGITEAEAISRVLNEVENWRQLSRNISRSKIKEGQMNYRTRSLWLPGLATLTSAMAALAIINRFDLQPRIFWYGSLAVVQMYLPWLAILPIFGAMGAYLSRRANGNLKARLAAATFPALVPFAIFCPAIAVATVTEHHPNWQAQAGMAAHIYFKSPNALPVAFAVMVFNWVLLPGAALALGALPFLRKSHLREVEHSRR